MGGLPHTKPASGVVLLDGNFYKNAKVAEFSSAVVRQAHPPSRARGPPCCAHLGDRTSRYEAEDLQREVDDDNASQGGG